jgi:hypothetical protein
MRRQGLQHAGSPRRVRSPHSSPWALADLRLIPDEALIGWLCRGDRRALVGGFGERSGSLTLWDVAENWQQEVRRNLGDVK